MKRIKSNKRYLWNFYVFPLVYFAAVTCYPTGKPDLEEQPEVRDEKHFPNGTVIGKYTYMDNEGNPIQVKYYADDASYGVELKSIKVVDSTGEPLQSDTQFNQVQNSPHAQNTQHFGNIQHTPNFQYAQNSQNVQRAQNIQSGQNQNLPIIQSKYDFSPMKNTESDMKIPIDMMNTNSFPTTGYKYKNDPYDFLNKEFSKLNRFKIEKPSPDYEIYYQNELKGPKKCGKEKVRVYFDKENRKIRNAVDNFDADKFCEQF